jgi:ABC-2 type transport system ATP-binding protein
VEGAAAEGAGTPLLSVRSVAKRYGAREALREISFDVRAGELVAVVGPNGAGKTTLLSIIAGAQSPSAGTVDGPAVGDGAAQIGWAPQQPALYSKLTVRENLQLFARLEGVVDAQRAVARMLAQTGLQARADERVQRLSGGNRQRVNVALGLLGDPRVLALDEPSSALDPGQRARLWQFVGALAAQGTSVLFSTHHLGEVRRYASRAIVLADGELLFDGTPAEFMRLAGVADGEDLEAAFVTFLAERGHS